MVTQNGAKLLGMSDAEPAESTGHATPRWRVLVTPRWLAWHLFAVVALWGMLWLGDWQLHRALSGNNLSWAYTFEWPIFAIFGVFFWVKTVRDELHPADPMASEPPDLALPAGARPPVSSGALRRDSSPDSLDAGQATAGRTVTADAADHAAGDHGPSQDTGTDEDRELAEYNAYLAKLNKEVKGHGRWHGLR
jgi:hypothetical protein